MDDDLDDYKLDTVFASDHVLHTSYKSDRSLGRRKIRVEQQWHPGKKLGAGTFGTVRFEKSDSGAERAVKTVRKDLAVKCGIDYRRELAALTIFSREKFAQQEIFVAFLGWFEDVDHVFLAMEYFQHGDLSNFISDMREPDAKSICSQLLDGLEIMHEKGFTHRDLKPKNIFVAQTGPSWWVKIGDFGISKRVMPDSGTGLRTTTFTQGYEAPELRHYTTMDDEDSDGETEYYTNAVDIWSLGCIVYEMVAHELPFPTSKLLKRFCDGRVGFPADSLNGRLGLDGISFLQEVLTVQPIIRPTATAALGAKWLAVDDPLTKISSLANVADSEDNTKAPEPGTILDSDFHGQQAHRDEMQGKQGPITVPRLDEGVKKEHGKKRLSYPNQETEFESLVVPPGRAGSAMTRHWSGLSELSAEGFISRESVQTEMDSQTQTVVPHKLWPTRKTAIRLKGNRHSSSSIGSENHQRHNIQKPTSQVPENGMTRVPADKQSFENGENVEASSQNASPRRPKNKRADKTFRSWWKKYIKLKLTTPAPGVVTSVFGVPLHRSVGCAHTALRSQDADGNVATYGYIPTVVAKTGAYLMEKAGIEDNLFLTMKSEPSRFNELLAIFDKPPNYGKDLVWDSYTTDDAALVLLHYLGSLPEPIIPLEVYEGFRLPVWTSRRAQGTGHINLDFTLIQAYQRNILGLPPLNRSLILYLLDLLTVLVSWSGGNLMNSQRLLDLIQPGILSHPQHQGNAHQKGVNQDVLMFLIDNHENFPIGLTEKDFVKEVKETETDIKI